MSIPPTIVFEHRLFEKGLTIVKASSGKSALGTLPGLPLGSLGSLGSWQDSLKIFSSSNLSSSLIFLFKYVVLAFAVEIISYNSVVEIVM